jgi:hypothetical protein
MAVDLIFSSPIKQEKEKKERKIDKKYKQMGH